MTFVMPNLMQHIPPTHANSMLLYTKNMGTVQARLPARAEDIPSKVAVGDVPVEEGKSRWAMSQGHVHGATERRELQM